MAAPSEGEERLNRDLYDAIMKGDDEQVIKLCNKIEEGPLHEMSIHKDTVIHVACDARRGDLVLKLLEMLTDGDPSKLTAENDEKNTILHEAAADSTLLPAAEEMLRRSPELLTKPNVYGEVPLFRAAKHGQKEMFRFLVNEIEKRELKEEVRQGIFQRSDGTTVLHLAVLAQHFELAQLIVRKYSYISNLKDNDEMTALQLLACNSSAFEYGSERGFMNRFMRSCLSRNKGNEDEIKQEDDDDSQTRILADSACIAKPCWTWPKLEEFKKKKAKYDSACTLAKLLIQKDTSWRSTQAREDATSKPKPHKYSKEEQESKPLAPPPDEFQKKKGDPESSPTANTNNNKNNQELQNDKGDEGSCQEIYKDAITTGETPLFLAAMCGNKEIVKEIMEEFPQALEHVNKKGRNILHVAIKYSQVEIFDMVKEKEIIARRLKTRTDKFGNTILHMAAKEKKRHYSAENKHNPALQLRRELILFEQVKEISPSSFTNHYNNNKETPEELFAITYSKLHFDSQEWMRGTSQNCTIVAVLIATVAFTAAYTIPGGPNENTGRPILLTESFFLVFIWTDVLSLTFALTSVAIFLSVLTSSFPIQDFQRTLPQRLMAGLTLLILSVAMMMVAFGATIILMNNDKHKLKQVGLYCAAFFPVIIFAVSHSSMYELLLSTVPHSLNGIWNASPRFDFAPLLSWLTKLLPTKTSARTSKPQKPGSPPV